MNNDEAKFILGAYRAGGADANDAMFAAALAQAERDPELRAWFEAQRKFDATMGAKLGELVPPAGLRDAILAGGRASQPRRPWWRQPAWLGAAAAIVLLGAGFVAFQMRSGGTLDARGLASFALNDLVDAHDTHVGYPEPLAGVQARLAGIQLGQPGTLDLDELRRKGCRSVRVAGRDVFEICFLRDGTWFHLYAAARGNLAPGGADARNQILSRDGHVSTGWVDGANIYALVARGGAETLRRVL